MLRFGRRLSPAALTLCGGLLVVVMGATACRRSTKTVAPAAPTPRAVRLAVSAQNATPPAVPWMLRLVAGQEFRRAQLPIRFTSRAAVVHVTTSRLAPKGVALWIRLRDGKRRPANYLRWEQCCSASQVAQTRMVLRHRLRHLGGTTRPREPLWPGSEFSRDDHANALVAGLRWLLDRALRADAFDLSDYLQVFLILSHSARDPVLRSLAQTVGPRLSRRFLKSAPRPQANHTAEKLFDHAAGLYFTGRFGVKPPPAYEKAVREAIRRAPRDKLLTLSPTHPTARQLLDGLVDLYFLYKLGLPTPRPYAEVVALARRFTFEHGARETLNTLEDRVYLATHLIYVLSDFNRDRLRAADVSHLVRFLKGAARLYLKARDVETLGELADSLKITGHDYRDPVLRKIVTMLLKGQNPDGSWGNPKLKNEYARYHTTWTAFNGLLEYRFPGRAIRDPVIRKAWLGK